ncbi:hypothetical protein [Streptacidiphilus fuscans]|uniref:Uncharacterized protein n=1 Tax=Streptacidiphilus fuscans TaxID=2789292 RepID=A0A931FHG5_9ACTN|nr:hypothetical protein [Streptacidiphilus fuscans]MBF9072350.1 hypothetical protein [Streptacidiphilus fuscans]
MAERMRHRSGNFAVYRGDVYRVFGDSTSVQVALVRDEEDDPMPAGLRPDPQDPTRVFLADPGQLEAWYRTRWTFRWRGEAFDAEGSSGGRITGWYAGRRLDRVADHLQRIEASAYLGTFPLDEVTDLTEHRTDLLAEWKEQHQR